MGVHRTVLCVSYMGLWDRTDIEWDLWESYARVGVHRTVLSGSLQDRIYGTPQDNP